MHVWNIFHTANLRLAQVRRFGKGMVINMKNWKNIGKRLLVLPIWLILIMIIGSAYALVSVFLRGWSTKPIAYVIYVFSFYTLTVFGIAFWKTIPGQYKRVKNRLYENKYANRYLTDVAYKTHVSLYGSLGINILYVGVNAVSAFIYQTHWFAIFAIYYGIMALMRFLLVRYVGKNHIGESRIGELKRSRTCAVILLTVNITLSGVVLMMVYYGRGFQYQGVLIYVIALYTFYTTTIAVKDMIKYRKYQSPVMSVSKIIKFASSLFSMLFLETAMFAQFGGDTSEAAKRIMIMATGAGISVIVVSMSVYVIARTTKEMKEY